MTVILAHLKAEGATRRRWILKDPREPIPAVHKTKIHNRTDKLEILMQSEKLYCTVEIASTRIVLIYFIN